MEDEVALDLFGAARPVEVVRHLVPGHRRRLVFSIRDLQLDKLTLSRNLAFSAIVLAVSFVILPRIVFGSAYADMRLVPYLMAVGLLAIRFRGAPDRRTAQRPRGSRLALLRDANRREHDQPWHGRRRSDREAAAPSTSCPKAPA